MSDCVIIGAGIAAHGAAAALRDAEPGTRIIMLNGETERPYKRTSLSKRLSAGLSGVQELEPLDWYQTQSIELISTVQVLAVDRKQRELLLSNQRRLPYGRLLLATGARPNPAPDGPDKKTNALVFRSFADARRLVADWQGRDRVRIVGGGILGVELAAEALRLGKQVSISSRSGTIMAGELPPALSTRLARLLVSQGAAIGTSPFPTGGEAIVWAIGSSPASGLAIQAGLECGHGIRVDAAFRTKDPAIWAAGDCSELPGNRLCHLWHDAESQGHSAGRSIAGQPAAYRDRPWRIKLELFGDYYFSMAPGKGEPLADIRLPPAGAGQPEIRQIWWGKPDAVCGVAMAGDAARAKQYESAVLEAWSLTRIRQELG